MARKSDTRHTESWDSPPKQYTVAVKTTDRFGSSTNANVSLKLTGKKAESGEKMLSESLNHQRKFRRGQSDVFILTNLPDLGELTKLTMWHDNTGIGPSWHVQTVEVHSGYDNLIYIFNVDQWFSKIRSDGKIRREIECSGTRERISMQETKCFQSIKKDRRKASRQAKSGASVTRGTDSPPQKDGGAGSKSFVAKSAAGRSYTRPAGKTDASKNMTRPSAPPKDASKTPGKTASSLYKALHWPMAPKCFFVLKWPSAFKRSSSAPKWPVAPAPKWIPPPPFLNICPLSSKGRRKKRRKMTEQGRNLPHPPFFYKFPPPPHPFYRNYQENWQKPTYHASSDDSETYTATSTDSFVSVDSSSAHARKHKDEEDIPPPLRLNIDRSKKVRFSENLERMGIRRKDSAVEQSPWKYSATITDSSASADSSSACDKVYGRDDNGVEDIPPPPPPPLNVDRLKKVVFSENVENMDDAEIKDSAVEHASPPRPKSSAVKELSVAEISQWFSTDGSGKRTLNSILRSGSMLGHCTPGKRCTQCYFLFDGNSPKEEDQQHVLIKSCSD